MRSVQDIEKGTISIAFVREALICLQERGFDEQAMLRRVGISPELLAAPQSRVSASQYGALWLGITDAIDDEFFGLDSHPLKAGSFTLLCHAVIHSETLEIALRRTLRFLRLTLDDFSGELEMQDDFSRIVLVERHDPATGALLPAKKVFCLWNLFFNIARTVVLVDWKAHSDH